MKYGKKNLALVMAALALGSATQVFAGETHLQNTFVNTDGQCTPVGGFNSFMVTALLNQASNLYAEACSDAINHYYQTNSNWDVSFTVANVSYDGPFLAQSTPDGKVNCRPGYNVAYEIQHCFLTVTDLAK